ncbi:MAG: DICT sensory domain-containing protein [Haloarculaceae archaeon]
MSLSELIAGVEDHEKTLTVFNADDETVAAVADHFTNRNVVVRSETTESGRPGEFVTLSDDGDVLAATGLDGFRETLTETPGVDTSENPYRPILDELDETMFTSWSTKQMVNASREIEDRAWRVGAGELHAGFQTLSTLEGELDVYERLGETDIEVHAYATPDVDPPGHDGFVLHMERSEEIAKSWFVVFDGDGDDDQKCALLAEERDPREFYGFWTYDPDTVDWIIDYLDSTYGVVEQ